MSPPNPTLLLLTLLLLLPPSTSPSPLSTIAISKASNATLVCALLPTTTNTGLHLNCTSLPSLATLSYPSSRLSRYTAIASGDGFLCALSSPPTSSTSTMKWWDFAHSTARQPIPPSKQVYAGPALSSLSAGDSHVCGLQRTSGTLTCWRWRRLSVPAGLHVSELAVGRDFVCALILSSGVIRCFGTDPVVVGKEPSGTFSAVAAGSRHACGFSPVDGLVCWGRGAPNLGGGRRIEIISLALGEDKTCAITANGTVACWGDDVELPRGLAGTEFVAIEAKGESFCGVVMANYSLVCWGSDAFRRNHVVFDRVLPGTCQPSSGCSCGILPGSGNICPVAGEVICQNCGLKLSSLTRPNSTPSVAGRGNGTGRRRLTFVILGSVGLAVGLVAGLLVLLVRFRERSGRVHHLGRSGPVRAPERAEPGVETHLTRWLHKGHGPTIEEFPMKVLARATDGFSESKKIGSGSFGAVYRARLEDGRVVAIKRAHRSEPASASTSRALRVDHREAAFLSELALLSRVNHKNLVRLIGFCRMGSERVLVYEFMTRGSLNDLLHRPILPQDSRPARLQSWPDRIRVALDAARGIEYLHSYAVPPIIHRDIKSSNILLDDTWTAKVSDFGLSIMSLDGDWSAIGSRTAGTVGYMDPEYYRLQHLTAKSDVYSFGVVMLEILTSCRVIQKYGESGSPKNVVEFAVPHILADDIHRVLDPTLPPPTPCEIEAVAYLGYLAADCVCPQGKDRPSMSEVVGGLERALAACSEPRLDRSGTGRSELELEPGQVGH